MITVDAVRFDRLANNGRNTPCFIACDSSGNEVEVVAKITACCDSGASALVLEAISAMLARDLGLPAPPCYHVVMSNNFKLSITDLEYRKKALASAPDAFGSGCTPVGSSVWAKDGIIPERAKQQALEIFAFDALIGNSDRRPDNPNMHVYRDEIWIFDHELGSRLITNS